MNVGKSAPRLAKLVHLRGENLEAWQRAITTVFDASAKPDEAARFSGDFFGYASGKFVLSATKVTRVQLIRSIVNRSQFDHFGISCVLAGNAAGMAGSTSLEIGKGDVYFIDLSQALSLNMSTSREPSQDFTLWVPRTRMLAIAPNDDVLHGLVLAGSSPSGGLVGTCLEYLAENAAKMTADSLDVLAEGILQLIGKVLAASPRAPESSATSSPLATFVSIRRFIDRNLTSPHLDVDYIANQFGLSRASIYRVFEPIGGVAGYIRKSRLKRAFHEITAPEIADRRISQVAYHLGFSNVGTFNRLFLAMYGVSPSEARAQAKCGNPVLKSQLAEEESLAAWLSQIRD